MTAPPGAHTRDPTSPEDRRGDRLVPAVGTEDPTGREQRSAADPLVETRSRPTVQVFGVRHHGPGSARSVLAALDAYGPDEVLIEGPADADPLIRWVGSADVEPPVALLAYAVEQPAVAAFWPFAVFSPEWQALRWAARHQVPAGFCDLPAAQVLAGRGSAQRGLFDDDSDEDEDGIDGDGDGGGIDGDAGGRAETGTTAGRYGADDVWSGEADDISSGDRPDLLAPARGDRARRRAVRQDPLRVMAQAGGYDDPERWWEDVVEGRHDGSSPFPLLADAMAELRADVGPPSGVEARREAQMRQRIRASLKAGRQRVAVVCGAWHAPVLRPPYGPAARDSTILRGAAKRKVALTWVPWTHDRLASASGYGAGITAPGWYHHLWTAPDRPIARWMTEVAATLRARDRPASSAHVIEAVRLAEALATLRGRPLAGLTEVTDAARSVLCDGDEVAVRHLHADLVVGQRLGWISQAVPTVPLEADLAATCRTLRLKRDAPVVHHDLDLRRSVDRQRSVLFHRLELLGIGWVRPEESQIAGRGTFRETWRAQWRPEHALAVVEAAVWGTTVSAAARSRTLDRARDSSLLELVRSVGRCLLADLPGVLDELLRRLGERAALDTDVSHLMAAVPELVRAARYGSVRELDTRALQGVAETMLLRICAGLPGAAGGLDDDAAAALRGALDEVHQAVALLAEDDPGAGTEQPLRWRDRWLDALVAVLDRADLHGLLAGRITRLLLDAERLDDAHRRVQNALSHGVPAAAKAGWVDGFFADGALLLIHDPQLRTLVDDWVGGLPDDEFVAVLPLVRRTFATFSTAERRLLAERIAQPVRPDATQPAAATPDPPRTAATPAGREAAALATVDLILGTVR